MAVGRGGELRLGDDLFGKARERGPGEGDRGESGVFKVLHCDRVGFSSDQCIYSFRVVIRKEEGRRRGE